MPGTYALVNTASIYDRKWYMKPGMVEIKWNCKWKWLLAANSAVFFAHPINTNKYI